MSTIVKKVKVQNVKGISDFDYEFNKKNANNIWLILGDNETNKTSLMDCIFALFTGVIKDKDKIKRGAKKGVIDGVIDKNGQKIKVRLSITPSGETIKITLPDGSTKTNKADLRALFPYTDIDIDEFVKWSDNAEGRSKQVKLVKTLIPQEVNIKINELEKKIKEEEPNRKSAWNDKVVKQKILDQLREEVETEGIEDINKYKESIDTNNVSEDLSKYVGMEENLNKYSDFVNKSPKKLKNAEETIKKKKNYFAEAKKTKENLIPKLDIELEEKIEALKKEYEAKKQQVYDDISGLVKQEKEYLEENEAKITAYKEKINIAKEHIKKSEVNPDYISGLRQKLKEAETWNTRHAKFKRILKAEQDFKRGRINYENKLKEIQGYNKEIEDLIKSNPLPVKGLSFNDEGLMFNGASFGSLSTSQQLYTALSLIMSINKKTKVFRLNRGESLAKNMDLVVDYATKMGYSGFIEYAQYGADEIQFEVAEVRNPEFVKNKSVVLKEGEKQPETPVKVAKDDIIENTTNDAPGKNELLEHQFESQKEEKSTVDEDKEPDLFGDDFNF